MGLCISFSSMIWVLIYVIYFLATTPGTLQERWTAGVTPVFDKVKKETVTSNGANVSTELEEIPLNVE